MLGKLAKSYESIHPVISFSPTRFFWPDVQVVGLPIVSDA
jgi:hypothetical protein